MVTVKVSFTIPTTDIGTRRARKSVRIIQRKIAIGRRSPSSLAKYRGTFEENLLKGSSILGRFLIRHSVPFNEVMGYRGGPIFIELTRPTFNNSLQGNKKAGQ